MSSTFHVPRERILSIPLALHPQPEKMPPTIHRKKVKVLFIGTFVPLQGTTVIAKAIHALRTETDIEFVIIGDGQESAAAAPWLHANDSVTWIRTWQSPDTLSEHLSQADICLGIFGGDGKASRVLPFKIYQALAAGKAVISQGNFSLPLGTPQPPMIHSMADPVELAKTIRSLASSAERRLQLGHDASQYFQRFLSNSSLSLRWRQLIENLH
ncbi:glycosyltransferase [Stenotrophomonas sp. SY1]|uniref:glycosyltransferase n=1 Tax=Stenotrophomonas sp. SY1 TaxID=477235 RepID=UPI001E2DBD13|nr:glycosyltransferase [Stenotrophomonas sp. SY1]MCD9086156.1 glycosyltransferase [Stenotrophomonas sp. SY1]